MMRKTKKLLGRYARMAVAFGILALMALALAGCFEPDAIAAVPATPTPSLLQPTDLPPATATPLPTARAFPLEAPAHVTVEHPAHQTCIQCHTDAEKLKASMPLHGATATGDQVHGRAASELPPSQWWELVYLNNPAFLETVHGRFGCITCHEGTGDTLLVEVAHMGLIREPSAAGLCMDCHVAEVSTAQGSLHANLNGYRTVLFARTSTDKTALLETMIGNHCKECHTATCGQCHVSRAPAVGGGLVAGHLFEHTPAIDLTCTGCHTHRIEDEYQGEGRIGRADIHWAEGAMACIDCHGVSEFHGTEEARLHRYDGQPSVNCEDSGCHPEVAEDDGIAQHGNSHLKNLSCQACHASEYQNCYGCHVHVEDGVPAYTLKSTQTAFKIGRNPIQGRYRPWKYVPVRHVPVARDSFSFYGNDLLTNFDALPTWKYATPHTIQRITPQNQSCNSCHGNADVFLTAADVAPDELNANRQVIVEKVPQPVD